MLRRVLAGSLACSLGGMLLTAAPALAAVPHTVLPGESLWSISAANGLTVAHAGGLQRPCGGRGPDRGSEHQRAHLSGWTLAAAPVAADARAIPAPGMSPVPSPYGDLYLTPAAAQAWNAMRSEALSVYGIDLYPGGPASAFRTYAQQAAALSGIPRRVRRARQPARHLLARAGHGRGRANARDALGDRPDRLEIRLGEGPRARRVVARRLHRRRLRPVQAGVRAGCCRPTP